MQAIIHRSGPLRGELRLPPDKAICHRAVLVAALAQGETEIHPWPSAEDCAQTLAVVQGLGVTCWRSPHGVRIEGRGRRGLRAPERELYCGESGTTLRLTAGVLAGQAFSATLTAAPSLSRRPMRRVIEPLSRMGAQITAAAAAPGAEEWHPPLRITGASPLRAIRYAAPVASAQVKSAVLLAGLFAEGRTVVVEPEQTRDHTERVLRHYGVPIRQEGSEVSLEPQDLSSPGALALPGDPSSATFFLVAALCVPGSRVTLQDVSLNPTRIRLLELLGRMGGVVRTVPAAEDAWEPRGAMVAEACALRAITVEPSEVPGVIDELPALMVAAACADGTTRLRGVGELRVKETDRIESMVKGLRALGVRIRTPAPDTVDIEGGRLTGAVVESAGDHRTAMSLAVAGLAARGATTILGAECVAKSFAEFFTQLKSLAGSSTVKTVDKA
jgi:3-phosphoshikimate 1-carboxyvinyltransferase